MAPASLVVARFIRLSIKGGSIVQGKTTAGNNIRQAAVLPQKLIKVQIVVAYDKFNVYIRQLCLHIRGVLLVQGR